MSKAMLAVAVVALAGVAVVSYDTARTAVVPSASAATRVAADGTPVNACELVTDEEIATVVGAEVTRGERRDDGEVGGKGDYAPQGTYSSTCFWQFKADADSPSGDINLPMGGRRFAILNAMVWPAGGGHAAKFLQSFRDAFKTGEIPSDPITVKIKGADDALWWGDGVAGRKGDTSFGISVFLQNGDKESQRKMEENLAGKIAGRL